MILLFSQLHFVICAARQGAKHRYKLEILKADRTSEWSDMKSVDLKGNNDTKPEE